MKNTNKKRALILFLLSVIIPCLIEKFKYPQVRFSFDRFFIIFTILIFISTFFIFDRKKELDFLYKKRYIIGLILFLILVLFEYHGSSISIYNQVVQANHNIESSNPIIGTSRGIRGDEWAVSTPTMLSQISNNFNEESSILNARKSKVSLYPKIVSKSISIIATPNQIGFLFLPKEQAFSFCYFFGYFLLFFSSFEFLMLVTKKNKLYSLFGTVLITFSPFVQWFDAWNIIGFGELAIVLLDKYLKENKLLKRILIAMLIGLVGCCYIMALYPAWQVPFGYLFLIMCIWVCMENKEDFSIKKLLLLIAIILICIAIVIVPVFLNSYDIFKLISNTSYPGKRFITGGNAWERLFYYFSSIFCFYREPLNASEMSQFISLYPIPIIMGLYYWIDNKKKYKKDFLLSGLLFLSIVLTIWNFIELPAWLVRITMLSMSTTERCSVTASFVCLLLLLYCLTNYSKDSLKEVVKYQNMIIAFIISLFGVYVVKNQFAEYMGLKFIIFDIIFYTVIMTLVLMNCKKTNKIAMIILCTFTLISGILVHPLNRGLSAIFDKPVAKKVQKIEKKDPEADWITVTDKYFLSNYLVASGADTINSTNYYPNFKLWKKIGLKKEKEKYNRYAHILIELTKEKSSVKVNYSDQLGLKLNNNDVCTLNVKYILSTYDDLEDYDDISVEFSKIYNDDGLYIYKVKCS